MKKLLESDRSYLRYTMKKTFQTTRLFLDRLHPDDAAFIFELLNTPDWLKFIGDRNIHSDEDARNYILKITADPNIIYWVVRSGEEKIGMVSFIKRKYLDHHDIGFAFLPKFSKQGFAFEAADAVLKESLQDPDHRIILATTMTDNTNSIHLLEKLGFQFNQEIENEGVKLLLYSIAAD